MTPNMIFDWYVELFIKGTASDAPQFSSVTNQLHTQAQTIFENFSAAGSPKMNSQGKELNWFGNCVWRVLLLLKWWAVTIRRLYEGLKLQMEG